MRNDLLYFFVLFPLRETNGTPPANSNGFFDGRQRK
jgi:hypothetical protein